MSLKKNDLMNEIETLYIDDLSSVLTNDDKCNTKILQMYSRVISLVRIFRLYSASELEMAVRCSYMFKTNVLQCIWHLPFLLAITSDRV